MPSPHPDRSQGILTALRSKYSLIDGELPYDISDYLHNYGHPVGALLYADLFVPDFQDIDGSVVLDDGTHDLSESFLEKRKSSTLSPEVFAASFNWRELPYMFIDNNAGVADYMVLGNLIAEAWRSRLAYLYPTRMFVVEVRPETESGESIIVAFVETKSSRE